MNVETHKLTLPWVESATSGFVFAQEMREAVSLALASGLNLIFSGPGGHGKSEFLTAVFGAISGSAPYVKSFGQGTSTEELYGGLDLDALNRQGGEEKAVIQYTPELSFLTYNVAVFEELFDAPSRVLTSLKDTLTARELRNGHQRFPMKTTVIAGATNHSPQDIAEAGPEIAALIERFPIQLEVKWSDYSEKSYMDLFDAVTDSAPAADPVTWDVVADLQERTDETQCDKSMQRALAKIIVELQRDNVTISPRTAVLAMRLAKAAAVINGRDNVTPHDLIAVCYLPGAHALKKRIRFLIQESVFAVEQEQALERLETEFEDLKTISVNSLSGLKDWQAQLTRIHNKSSTLQVSTDLYDRRNALTRSASHALLSIAREIEEYELKSLKDEHLRILGQYEHKTNNLYTIYRNPKTRYYDKESAHEDMRDLLDDLHGLHVHSSLHHRHSALVERLKNVVYS